MKSIALVLAILLVAAQAFAAPAPSGDPCQSSSVAKKSAPILPSANGFSQIIAGSGQTIHVCGFLVDLAPFEFAYASINSNCSTPAAQLTGTVQPSTGGGPYVYSGPGTIFTVPANNSLCLNATGPNGANGVVTYTSP